MVTGRSINLVQIFFDDYWMYYQTRDMADGGNTPYSNLKQYVAYKKKLPDAKLLNTIDEEL